MRKMLRRVCRAGIASGGACGLGKTAVTRKEIDESGWAGAPGALIFTPRFV